MGFVPRDENVGTVETCSGNKKVLFTASVRIRFSPSVTLYCLNVAWLESGVVFAPATV